MADRGGATDLAGRHRDGHLAADAVDAQLQRDAGISHFEYPVMAMLSTSRSGPGGGARPPHWPTAR